MEKPMDFDIPPAIAGRKRRVLLRLRAAGAMGAYRMAARRLRRKTEAWLAAHHLVDTTSVGSRDAFEKSCGISLSDAAGLRRKFVEENPARHFLENPGATAALCQREFPGAVQETMRVADAVCEHRFELLGRTADFGPRVDWLWCPETGGSWPSFEGDSEGALYQWGPKPGDLKYPWELNRHQYLVSLGKAYQYTGDDKYVHELAELVVSWREANPFFRGLNWVAMMELGVRTLSWLNALWLVRDSELFAREGLPAMLHGLYQHGVRLSSNMTTDWLVRSNHVIGEAAGLFALGVLLPGFRESRRWRQEALNVFTRELIGQTFEDGVNREQAAVYHRYIADFVLVVLALAQANGIPAPAALQDRFLAMLDYLDAITLPDGTIPTIGDSDDGRGIVLSESVPLLDARAWPLAGRILLQYRARLTGGSRNEEALWFLGAAQWPSQYETETARQPVLFRKGGVAVLRSGPDRTGETVAMMRCGPFGFKGNGASSHSHSDLLAPIVYWRGQPLSVDTGTGQYYGPPALREFARCAAAHNTFVPRSMDQARRYPVWDWDKAPRTRVVSWRSDPESVGIEAQLDSPLGFLHKRRIVLDRNPLALVFDDELTWSGRGETPLDWHLHLAPGLGLRLDTEGKALVLRAGTAWLTIEYRGFEDAAHLTGWTSPAYGEVRERSVLRLSVTGSRVKTQVRITEASPGPFRIAGIEEI
ncbi:MAG: hypothetical protein QG656_841, partial [Candidatus Hydrogenedentes bacterium]|nr:hypothetical protein [Candidatus Hydrogenedentota bacterium]